MVITPVGIVAQVVSFGRWRDYAIYCADRLGWIDAMDLATELPGNFWPSGVQRKAHRLMRLGGAA